ncbi:hypothetical protein [Sorangium sp. So ce1024]|uniref:hypothetical protein n=1 Tax=Sorangium sp. So ce1024 TaxID=3133327 RepID=UPI003F121BDE
MSAPLPYCGISGLVSRTEVLAALAAFPDCGRQLMVGVLASEKTLAGQTNRYFRRYPKVENISHVFVDDPRCLNLLHYGADTPPDATTLIRLFELAGPLCHGFQFNGAWPYRADLFRLHEAAAHRGRDLRVVLQVRVPNRQGTATVTWPSHGHYGGLFSDILLDASGGTGRAFDYSYAETWVEEVRARYGDKIGVGIAGGLCAETLAPVAPVLAEGASCDAEGRLRDGADGGGRLDLDRVKAYLAAAAEAIWDACEHDDQEVLRDGLERRCRVCGAPSVYCHPCSEAGGACRGIYHAPPACPGRDEVSP